MRANWKPTRIPETTGTYSEKDAAVLNSLLNPCGVALSEFSIAPQVTTYIAELPADCNLRKIRNLNYGIALNNNDVSVTVDGAKLKIAVPTNNYTLTFDKYASAYKDFANDIDLSGGVFYDVPVSIGENGNGEAIETSMSRAKHMLICGATGSGKSSALHSIICTMLLGCWNQIQIYGVDCKGTELAFYSSLPNFHFIHTADEAVKMLEAVRSEMQRRYQQMENNGKQDIIAYNKQYWPRLMPIIVVVDELAELMLTNKKVVEPLLVSIAQLGRAAGIHLILSTQSPNAQVVTGQLRANIPTRLVLKTATVTDSVVALGRKGSEKLLGKGDAYFLDEKHFDPVRVQVPWIDEEEIREIVEAVKEAQEKAGDSKYFYKQDIIQNKSKDKYARKVARNIKIILGIKIAYAIFMGMLNLLAAATGTSTGSKRNSKKSNWLWKV